MKNLTKKLLILFVSVLVVLSSGTVRLNAEINRAGDETGFTINGFEGGETVTFYKLLKAVYEETDPNTKDKLIKDYVLANGLVDAKDSIELPSFTREATQEDVDNNKANSTGEEITIPAVTVLIENLATDATGKIVNIQTIEGEEYTLSTIDSKVYANKELKISDLVGKYPFNTSKPKERQINAISAAIAKKELNIDKVIITTSTGTDDHVIVDAPQEPGAGKVSMHAYAKKNAEQNDNVRPAIYDATGIYLVRIETASDRDEVYNPVIVSVGYAHDENDDNELKFTAEGYNVTQNYRYDGTDATVKKSKPNVKKSVTGGIEETNVDEPVVALDLDGDPLNYVIGNPDSLTYIKKDHTQQDVINALKIADETDRKNALDECTTTECEEALTKKEVVQSGSEGTKFTYTVVPTLPAYPVNAINKTLWFSDSMSDGLDYVEGSLNVQITGATITKKYDSANKKYNFYVNNANGKYTYADVDETAVDDTNPATVSLLATAVDTDNGFKLTFDYDAIPGGKDADLSLTYDACIKTKEAIVGLHGMPNVVTMIYANNPDDGSTHDVKNNDQPSGNGLKEIEDYEIVYTYEIYFKKIDEQGRPLKDAIFELRAAENIYYDDDTLLYAENQLVCTIKTNDNGIGYTTEVGPGKYYLQEIEAPSPYQLNSTKYPVEASWTSATKKVNVTHESWEYTTDVPNKDGYTTQVGWLIGTTNSVFYQLADYPLTVDAGADGKWVYNSEYKTLTKGNLVIENVYAAYINPETHVISNTFKEEKATNNNTNNNGWVLLDEPIPNTKTPELPSTGGIGTYLFTIAGVAIIATAMFMLIFRKREEHNH